MLKNKGLITKLIAFFVIMLLSILLMTGVSSYYGQMAVQRDAAERNLQNIVQYLATIMEADSAEFVAYQKLSIKVSDKVVVPTDFDGDYHPAKLEFYKKFNERYPGKGLGSDVAYEDMPEDLQILFVTYKQEYWLHVFEQTRDNFEVAYTYYVVPTGEELHMYYLIDAIREGQADDKSILHLNIDVYQDLDTHSHMWEAWNNAAYTPGYDIQDNEYGKTYICYYPLIIDGAELGVVCADMYIANVDEAILRNSIRQVIGMGILMIPIISLISFFIMHKYVKRLIILQKNIGTFSENKDPSIAEEICKRSAGKDEIDYLGKEVAEMITEIGDFMKKLIDKNKELTDAQEKIRAANELANKDALTGIRNKTAYDLEVKRIEDRIRVGENRFGIAIVDLNFLKKINDTYGHEKGNLSIIKLCFVVCHIFQHSPVFRIGGDEFAIILYNEDYDNYKDLIDEFFRQQEQMQNDPSLDPWNKISAAVGVSFFDPATDTSLIDVFKRADADMYDCKKRMKANRD